jgi:L-lactate dehydrogenase complex protein LldG
VVHNGILSDLAVIPVGLTGAEAGLADTGTIVVRNGPGHTPLASLLPPAHVAILQAGRIFPDMRAYFSYVGRQPGASEQIHDTSNLVFITGPSRTADIEQTLTLGVHGPRELIIVVWG